MIPAGWITVGAQVAWYLFLALACAGAVVIFGGIWGRGHFDRFYLEANPKYLIAFMRLVSGGVAFFSNPSVNHDVANSGDWPAVSLVAAFSWFTWECVQILAEKKAKVALDALDELDRAVSFRTLLLTTLRRMVQVKKKRIEDELSIPDPRSQPILRARRSLDPKAQIYLALEQMALFLRTLHRDPDSEEALHQNFRIGLYVALNDRMQPLEAFDFNNPSSQPFTSYRETEQHFRLDNNDRPAHAVRCVREGRLIIVPDCAAAKPEEFTYFRDAQRNYLRSMIAYPILPFRAADGTMTSAAVVIDTDVAGHFKEEDRRLIQFFMDQFAARLTLETLLVALMGE